MRGWMCGRRGVAARVYWMVAGAAVASAVSAGSAAAQVDQLPRYDSLGSCATFRATYPDRYADRAMAVLMIDRTDPVVGLDRETLMSGTARILRSLKPGDELAVHQISDNPVADRNFLFRECLPGCPDVPIWQRLVSQCDALRADGTMGRFGSLLRDRVLALIGSEEPLPFSNIVDAIVGVSQSYAALQDRRIYIFSDMVEYRPSAQGRVERSFFRMSQDDLEQHKDWVAKHRLMASLQGAEVRIFGFGGRQFGRQEQPKQYPAIRQFWEWYFAQAGVGSLQIKNQALDE